MRYMSGECILRLLVNRLVMHIQGIKIFNLLRYQWDAASIGEEGREGR